MNKKYKKLLRRFAFLMAISSYRRVVLTYLAFQRCYFDKVLQRTWLFDDTKLHLTDYDFYMNMFETINKENCNNENLTILYALVCKVYAKRITDYGVYEL